MRSTLLNSIVVAAAAVIAAPSVRGAHNILTDGDWMWCPKSACTIKGYIYDPLVSPDFFVRAYRIRRGSNVLVGVLGPEILTEDKNSLFKIQSFHELKAADIAGPGKLSKSVKYGSGEYSEFGLLLPLVPRVKVTTADLAQNGKFARATKDDPTNWAEAVFGRKLYDRDAKDCKALPAGSDINGDGVPDLIVGYDHANHCCQSAVVYALGDKFHKQFELDGGSTKIFFRDLDGDGICEVLITDSTFENWNVFYPQSPRPRLILRIKNGNQVKVATNLMKAPVIADSYLQRIVVETKRDMHAENGLPPRISGEMIFNIVQLIYVGHAADAWKYVDQSWPPGAKAAYSTELEQEAAKRSISKEEFKEQIRKQLSRSPYFAGIKELNNGQL